MVILTVIPLMGQTPDSTSQKSPVQAVKRALLFPGGGQFYNGQNVKGILLVGAALGAGFLYISNANEYMNYGGSNASEKKQIWMVDWVCLYLRPS